MIAEVNITETKLTKPAWYQTTAKYAQSNLGRSLWQIFDTLVPYFALWAAMIYTVQTELPYWITLTLAVVAAAFWFGFLSFSTIAAMDPSLRRAGQTPS